MIQNAMPPNAMPPNEGPQNEGSQNKGSQAEGPQDESLAGTRPDSDVDDVQSDLAWTAFLYVSGELPGDRAEEFEGQLAAGGEAAEAVARAAELACIIAEANTPLTTAARSRGLSRALGWMAAGAAVATVVFSLSGFGYREDGTTQRTPTASEEAAPNSNLVGAWHSLQDRGDWTGPRARWRRPASVGLTSRLPATSDELPSWVGSLEQDSESE